MPFRKFQISKRGFTLIELLIVVAIIAVLVGVGSVSFTTARRQGRDATRQADLKKVASALETYFADNTSYPIDNSSGDIQCGIPILATIDWGMTFSCVIGGETKVYLQELPEEPTGTLEYFYEPQDRSANPCTATAFACQQYIISANLENPTHPAITAGLPCTPQIGYNYCIVSPSYVP
ncbi:prepilin-type N-terminal cleavage/methylation domain-containing protein [Patescibacteria group bacterium]|nr:prepilin-type N-terminal cleavage/methylation domain-containing protein [Patescibacteria group bacterium]